MKKFNIFILLLILALVLGGCALTRPVESLDIVFAIGIDKGTEDKRLITLAMPVFEKQAEEKSLRISAEGKDLLNGVKRASQQTEKEVVLGQTRVVVLGEELLKERGLEENIDPLVRDPAFPLNAFVIVGHGTAQELLAGVFPTNPRLGTYLQQFINSGRRQALIFDQDLSDFFIRLNAEGWDPTLPYVKKGEKGISYLGTMLFRGDKAIDNLDVEETQTGLLLGGKAKNVKISFSDPIAPERYVTLEVVENQSKVKTRIADGNPEIDIEVKIEADIMDKDSLANLLKKGVIKEKERGLAVQFTRRAEQLLQKLQNLQTDPIGFGAYLRAQNYAYWQQIGDEGWRERFSMVKFNVTSEVKIRRFGVTIK